MKKVLAALAGAVVAPLVVLLGVGALYSAPAESWDLGTPLLTLGALLPAALLGAGVGYVVAEMWSTGSRRQAGWLGGAGAILVILIPVGIVVYPHILSILPSRPPTAEEKRAAWAQRLGKTPGPLGARLADRLGACLGEEGVPPSGEAVIGRGCEEIRAHWLGPGADRIASLGAYTDADDGWRWDLVDSAGRRRLRVFPDPLLNQAGPTFEVERGGVARHDAPAAPDAGADSMLPRLARFRRCLRDLAIEARGSGAWAGLADTLPLLLRASAPEPRCPGARIEQTPDRPRFAWRLSVPNGGAPPLSITYQPRFEDSLETPFDLYLFAADSGYLVDAGGRWHARQGGWATYDDPPPGWCRSDPSAECR